MLKRLELVGFKSFADKTQFDFTPDGRLFLHPEYIAPGAPPEVWELDPATLKRVGRWVVPGGPYCQGANPSRPSMSTASSGAVARIKPLTKMVLKNKGCSSGWVRMCRQPSSSSPALATSCR